MRIAFEGGVFATFSALFALAALVLQENLVFLMGCVSFAAAWGARWPARWNLRGLEIEREVPRRARAGVGVWVSYAVRNPRSWPAAAFEVFDRTGRRTRPVSLALEVSGLGRRKQVRRSSRLMFIRRGLHRLGGVDVKSRFPLGFFRATARVELSNEILVRPREGSPAARLRDWLGGRAETHRRPSLLLRGPDALHGVRDFRDGDDPRRIHWRTTARRGGMLTVTQWRRERGRSLILILGRGHGAGAVAVRTFERAVSVVATIWRVAHREGLEAELVLGDGRRGRGDQRMGPGLDRLATVRAQGGRRPRGALRELSRNRRGRLVVYVGTGPEPGIERRLAAAAGRHGASIFVRADQPEVRRWVRGLDG